LNRATSLTGPTRSLNYIATQTPEPQRCPDAHWESLEQVQ
jgi:hypothetical protein